MLERPLDVLAFTFAPLATSCSTTPWWPCSVALHVASHTMQKSTIALFCHRFHCTSQVAKQTDTNSVGIADGASHKTYLENQMNGSACAAFPSQMNLLGPLRHR